MGGRDPGLAPGFVIAIPWLQKDSRFLGFLSEVGAELWVNTPQHSVTGQRR